VYSISHDLRAPLLSIQGLLGLINTQGLRDENREYLGLIGESTKRLDQTILEILNYSRNARLDVQFESFNLKMTMANILSDLGSMRLDVKTTLDWSGEEEVVQDEIRVGVLLKNIIANAIKYSKPGGGAWVEVRAIATPQAMQIIITDNGEGIDTHHLRQVFDMFYRATTSSPGTGLGLYVSKEITEKIGGTISIESTLNIGTEVTIILPQHEHEQISID
jgi:signal transduction histidine kinase